MMRWYTVNEEYLNYLRKYENRLPKIDYGDNKLKPFFGELFSIGDLVYITQVSHPKRRHYSMKNNKDFIKLFDGNRIIAVVNLNYMFPVHKSKLYEIRYGEIDKLRKFDSERMKRNYISLLKKEMREIKNNNVSKMAKELYEHRYEYPNSRISNRCFDFKKIEQKCIEYKDNM
jgi:protein AbiQ